MDELYRLTVLRQSERRAEAQRAREARAGAAASTAYVAPMRERFGRRGLRGRLGRLLIATGRMLEGRDDPVLAAPSPRTARVR